MSESTRRGLAMLATMAIVGSALVYLQTQPATATDGGSPVPAPGPIDEDPWLDVLGSAAGWVDVEAGSAVLTVQPLGLRERSAGSLRLRVMAGHHEYSWRVDLAEATTDVPRQIAVALPDDVLLDPVVTDYAVDLFVDVVTEGVWVTAPKAYVVWPDGPDADPQIWSADQLERLAPHGVVNPELAATLVSDLDPHDRVLPPILGTARPARALPEPGAADTALGELL